MTSNVTCTVNINSACHSYQLGRECYISELHRCVLRTAESDENTRFANKVKLLLYCAESPLNIFDKVGSIEQPAQIKAQFITENTHSEPDFTKFNVRFRIPIDILELSRLSPLEYLTKFTEVKSDVAEFYKIKYGKHSRMQKMRRKELKAAMEDIFKDLAEPVFKRVSELLDAEEVADFLEFDLFIGVCSFGNRVISRVSELDGIVTNSPPALDLKKLIFLEVADFYQLKAKLEFIEIRADLKELLLNLQIN